jgi:competence protein ComEA
MVPGRRNEMRRATAGILTLIVALACAQFVAAQTTTAAKAPATVVNVNTASADQLDALPGIGPALAARIIEYRQKNGAFKKLEDLMNVRGIGEKNFLKLKPLLTLGTPKPAAGGPAQ